MKDKVTNPSLKNNLTLESISNFLANILSDLLTIQHMPIPRAFCKINLQNFELSFS